MFASVIMPPSMIAIEVLLPVLTFFVAVDVVVVGFLETLTCPAGRDRPFAGPAVP